MHRFIATPSYEHLLPKGMEGYWPSEVVAVNRFPDGETDYTIPNLYGTDITLIAGTHDAQALMECYDIACGLVDSGARRMTIILPYFGYSTMERRSSMQKIVVAKNRARMLDSIPTPPGGICFFLIDPHTEGLSSYFSNRCETIRMGKPWVEYIRNFNTTNHQGEEFVMACGDTGRFKQVEWLSGRLDVESAVILKKRTSGKSTEIIHVMGDVAGKHVYLYDDMIRSGGTLRNAAREFLGRGAKTVTAFATHAPLVENFDIDSTFGDLDHIVTTDTHPNHSMVKNSERWSIFPISEELWKAMQNYR